MRSSIRCSVSCGGTMSSSTPGAMAETSIESVTRRTGLVEVKRMALESKLMILLEVRPSQQ